ncbi:folylpolyglutamate synthase [Elysia marginata]|uniref:Folylpolyglutamate synthase n=1 Tax=Elysia marginata TaxID=1093978 RepID=A0AAV4G8C0_9GAST|nr:folylpolyglutamate synthase [Elysia marginata]
MSVSDIPRLETSVGDLDQATVQGLKACYWPGRTEIIRHEGITYYLDGAHTGESIENCAQWFKDVAGKEKAELESRNGKVIRLLLFNVTKKRNPVNLLRHLTDCQFDEAAFTPNLMSTVHHGNIMDHYDSNQGYEELTDIPKDNQKVWDALVNRQEPSQVFPCVLQALSWVTQGRDPLVKVADPSAVLPEVPHHCLDATHIQVLVTGSLLLVGPVLGILKPGFND